ncbi:hypothetical protein GGF31_000166 [Allomyces arbusculus]|nr:hypothetical protein GGF31_000166 [Allomyces arbusculus]
MASYHVLSALVIAALLVRRVDAHMQMMSPFPRLDPANPSVPESQKDYNIVAPLGWNNLYPFPCRGAPVGSSVLTVQPGGTIQVQLGGGAAHNGGHCQFSISYNGQDFVVLKTVLTDCMAAAGNSFSVPVPSTTPGGKAIFSWSWVNASGNREFYQNCADITINGPATGALSGPKMVVANVPGYPTIGEFGAGAGPGLSYYQSAPTIQISPSGGSGPASTPSTGGYEVPSSPLAPADVVVDTPTAPAAAPEAESTVTPASPDAEPAVVYTAVPAAPATPASDPVAPAFVPDYLAAQPDAQASPTVVTPATSKLSRPTTARPSNCYAPPPLVISQNGTTTARHYRSHHYSRRQHQPKATPALGTPVTTEPTFY